MAYSNIAYEIDGAVARLSHDRPALRNAESQELLDELDDAVRRATADPAVRVLVFDGKGEHFSAGHDLKQGAEKRAGFSVEQRWAYEELYYLEYALRIWDCPKPTIASVQGACIAGGFMVANMCDLIVAADDAFFSDPVCHTLGAAAVEVLIHPWVMGARKAKEMLFMGGPSSQTKCNTLSARCCDGTDLHPVVIGRAVPNFQRPRRRSLDPPNRSSSGSPAIGGRSRGETQRGSENRIPASLRGRAGASPPMERIEARTRPQAPRRRPRQSQTRHIT